MNLGSETLINHLSRRESILIGFAIFLCLGYFYIMFFLSPIMTQIKEARRQIEEYNINSAKKIITESENKNTKNPNDLSKFIPDMERNSEIAYNIKMMADKSLVELDKVSFGDIIPVDNKNYNFKISKENKILAIPIHIIVLGVNNNLIKLIKAFEADVRLCEIVNISISQGDINQATADIELRYFCFNNGG